MMNKFNWQLKSKRIINDQNLYFGWSNSKSKKNIPFLMIIFARFGTVGKDWSSNNFVSDTKNKILKNSNPKPTKWNINSIMMIIMMVQSWQKTRFVAYPTNWSQPIPVSVQCLFFYFYFLQYILFFLIFFIIERLGHANSFLR